MSRFLPQDAWRYKQSFDNTIAIMSHAIRREIVERGLKLPDAKIVPGPQPGQRALISAHTIPEIKELERRLSMVESLGRTLGVAQTVLWDPTIWKLSQRNYQAFCGTPLPEDRQSPKPPQLWLFPGGIDYFYDQLDAKECLEVPDGYRLFGIFLVNATFRKSLVDSVVQVLIYEPKVTMSGWVHHMKMDQPQNLAEHVTPEYAPLIAAERFLELEWVGIERQPPSRQTRRWLERHKQEFPDIRTIVLRRAARKEQANGEHRDIDWQCQWFVSGHWRKYLGTDGAWRRTWVRDHIKGPDDKPLRIHDDTIYVAKR